MECRRIVCIVVCIKICSRICICICISVCVCSNVNKNVGISWVGVKMTGVVMMFWVVVIIVGCSVIRRW